MKHRGIFGVVVVMGGFAFVRASSSQDIDLMAKWTAASVVHYEVSAEFSGEALLFSADGMRGRGMVTDRFEVAFDWDQPNFSMIGKPVIRNFPSRIVSILKNGDCTTTVSGAFEHATIVELRNDPALAMANAVHAETQRDLPAGTVAGPNEVEICGTVQHAAARSVRHRLAVAAPNGMMLAMPSGQAGYRHDGKTFVIEGGSTEDKGWTFKVTPTIVK